MSLEEQIAMEVDLYVNYCRLAAQHDAFEKWHRMMAHAIFVHIQEMRSTGQASPLGRVTYSTDLV